MSAFLVSKPHIDALVYAALSRRRCGLSWYDCDPVALEAQFTSSLDYFAVLHVHHREARHEDADRLGRMLWQENLASVTARYPDDASGERPGPCGLTDEQIAAYTYTSPRTRLEPVAILKALHCYEYQSCEHDGWRGSEAYQFCQALQAAMISALPGYDEADWEIA